MQPHFGLKLVTPPGGEPLEVSDAAPWLRSDLNDEEQRPVIDRLIADARRRYERVTCRALMTQTWRLSLDRFPGYDPGAAGPSPAYDPAAIGWGYLRLGLDADPRVIRLPRPPLQAVASVTYYDGQGVQQALYNTLPAAVAAPGSQAVTPASMASVTPGATFVVDAGAAQEAVTVTEATATTFTATFARAHAAGAPFWASGYGAAGPVQVDAESEPGRLLPAFGATWPVARVQLASVQVTYVAGYGTRGQVPEDVQQRLLAHVAHCYERRENADEDYLNSLFDSLVSGAIF